MFLHKVEMEAVYKYDNSDETMEIPDTFYIASETSDEAIAAAREMFDKHEHWADDETGEKFSTTLQTVNLLGFSRGNPVHKVVG